MIKNYDICQMTGVTLRMCSKRDTVNSRYNERSPKSLSYLEFVKQRVVDTPKNKSLLIQDNKLTRRFLGNHQIPF